MYTELHGRISMRLPSTGKSSNSSSSSSAAVGFVSFGGGAEASFFVAFAADAAPEAGAADMVIDWMGRIVEVGL
jgi:hypothetical protein